MTAGKPGITVKAKNSVFDLQTSSKQPLMTSKLKMVNYGFMHFKQKLGTQEIQFRQRIQCDIL